LDPNEYLTFRGAALLFTDELRELVGKELNAASGNPLGPGQPTMEQWFQEHQQLRALLQKGGRFDVKPRPDGTIDIRRVPKS